METFTKSELEVMQVLWQHGPLKPGDLEAAFPRPIGNAALRSLLLILLEKGHVAREKDGRAFVYRAVTRREGELRKLTRRLADIFSDGSPKALIAQMVRAEKLSEEDLRELQALARETKDHSTAKGRRS